MKQYLIPALILVSLAACRHAGPPEPYGPLPSERQMAWHQMEYYMFIHFTVNTFTGREWGYGDERESVFNPSEMDCRQWPVSVVCNSRYLWLN